MRVIEIEPPRIKLPLPYTQQTDLYMYGTLLYELFTETSPFSGQLPHAIIYQVGRGIQPSTSHIQCTNTIKVSHIIFYLNITP